MKTLPKEYILENTARYDVSRLSSHLSGVLTLCDLSRLHDKDNSAYYRLFRSFFRQKEHADVADDILLFVLDEEENLPAAIVKKRLLNYMDQSGFFG